MTARDVDHAVASIARRQHGVVARRQGYEAGGSAKIIRSRLSAGLWVPLDNDVFAFISHPCTWKRQLMAAVLAQREAMVFNESAAALHGLADFRPGRPDVLVPRGSAHQSTLARVHEGDAFEYTLVDHIPVLTVADVFVAIAGRVKPERLRVAFESALIDRNLTMLSMQRRFLTFVGSRRPGLSRLGALIETYARDEAMVADSVLEFALYAMLGGPGMPAFRCQQPLPWAPDRRADAMLVGSPVIVEADGRSWHTRTADFATDRRRDNDATVHGFDTLRYTYAEITTDPRRVGAEIAAVHRRYQPNSSR